MTRIDLVQYWLQWVHGTQVMAVSQRIGRVVNRNRGGAVMHWLVRASSIALAVLGLAFLASPLLAQKKDVIPHAQDKMPGPALSPAEAIKRMVVPEGFTVELVAAEPDIVNPVAMTFDERGRIWIAESLEYPRSAAGPGRDRIKILESTKGDGHYDKITIFADGLNIPSGIAVGHGGVWVANAPDILFYKIGPDGKAAGPPEVVVTGFGRTDTHELPNSLTWGPDGWLYGLNGVFNHSHVKHQDREYRFTCALFRIHPKTHAFELFAEGTSNPWGIAFDTEGSAFVSACVIDHLWHLVETGYYHRQGGAYPPFTWKIGSIVKHKHQKAAYCGLHFFDSDAYPPEYREKLYMGNIHGGCINVDELTRDGSTYFAKPRPDFLTANDPWFMPVVQKTGPDGCLYILDWYDRYHCYQDARRDPEGIDRLRGRLYRVRYKGTPRAGLFDLAKESDEQLIQRLYSPNVFFRDLAQRLLSERMSEALSAKVEPLVLSKTAPRKARMHALWAIMGGGSLSNELHHKLLTHTDAGYRAWGVRAAGNFANVQQNIIERVGYLILDTSPDVQLQFAIALGKIPRLAKQRVGNYVALLAECGEDKLIPHIVWQNLHPLWESRGVEIIDTVIATANFSMNSPAFRAILPRLMDRMLSGKSPRVEFTNNLLNLPVDRAQWALARECLAVVTAKVQSGEIAGPAREVVRKHVAVLLGNAAAAKLDPEFRTDAVLLTALLGDEAGLSVARQLLQAADSSAAIRLHSLDALVLAKDSALLDTVGGLLSSKQPASREFLGQMLAALGRLDDPRLAEVVLSHYARLDPETRSRAVDLLTQRSQWGKKLMQAVSQKQVPPDALSVNQVRKLLASKDAELIKQVKAVWGTVREERNPEREKLVAAMRTLLQKTPGDAQRGVEVYKTACAKCHKMHGEGQDVGHDITANGRNDFDQLLSNVFDPSLVIGAAYQATTVATKKGQVLTGLLVEDNQQRVVLKTEGGKLETVPRGDIDEMAVSKVSLMPEGVEKQLKPQEIADLFAFLTLDKPPGDPAARKIPGAPK